MDSIVANIVEGEKVLLIWSDLGSNMETLQTLVSELNGKVGSQGRVAVENAERLKLARHEKSSFTKALSGVIGIPVWHHSTDFLGEILRILAPNGSLTIVEAVEESSKEKMKSNLVLSGFAATSDPLEYSQANLSDEDMKKVEGRKIFSWTASKPNFEVGASKLLSFAKKPVEEVKPSVWTLDDLDDDTVELIDENELVNEEDLAKPDPTTLRVCGTTGKRKACKDCSCGLREELEDGKEVTKKSVTSSCGSCYLGDAFRCASCPYLGMPAFKPGEKIQLSDRQLNPDLKST